jgi:hypothetical protein
VIAVFIFLFLDPSACTNVPSTIAPLTKVFLYIFFGGIEYVGHSFAYVTHFVFLRDVWILTQRAGVASRRATNLATRLSLTKVGVLHTS